MLYHDGLWALQEWNIYYYYTTWIWTATMQLFTFLLEVESTTLRFLALSMNYDGGLSRYFYDCIPLIVGSLCSLCSLIGIRSAWRSKKNTRTMVICYNYFYFHFISKRTHLVQPVAVPLQVCTCISSLVSGSTHKIIFRWITQNLQWIFMTANEWQVPHSIQVVLNRA